MTVGSFIIGDLNGLFFNWGEACGTSNVGFWKSSVISRFNFFVVLGDIIVFTFKMVKVVVNQLIGVIIGNQWTSVWEGKFH
ncbi:hypothetical protein WICPIJ_008662 [Wickerhamomyces pijperi]|uniref:Uncharacterized protein n=1 Tax=Wickerhamomyces pijperi TaxID=599730 RepID=A0A9P8PXW5_WICPI|nr:hypothetical protein WICPIJ_008662 [Wickerhamomyces pijperi]